MVKRHSSFGETSLSRPFAPEKFLLSGKKFKERIGHTLFGRIRTAGEKNQRQEDLLTLMMYAGLIYGGSVEAMGRRIQRRCIRRP